MIGNDVMIGAGSLIMDGVTIADGAVVGAGSVVTKDVAPYEIVAGVPARHMRFRFSSQIISELLQMRWWDRSLDALLTRYRDCLTRPLPESEQALLQRLMHFQGGSENAGCPQART